MGVLVLAVDGKELFHITSLVRIEMNQMHPGPGSGDRYCGAGQLSSG